ncbi:hypothetical protein ElyMa_001040200 [Elysia marginata]|uniref:Uncharacterized protein n=1 Tax=Elysia marginata TaxID=1093978 RepID=A0AAV4HRI4_9GAST|nr:hypothetical protein ElyMa_001040200 [Elysia marginata]
MRKAARPSFLASRIMSESDRSSNTCTNSANTSSFFLACGVDLSIGTPSPFPGSRKSSLQIRHHRFCTSPLDDISDKKKKKKKKEKDYNGNVEPHAFANEKALDSLSADITDSGICLSKPTETTQNGPEEQTSPDQRKHKKKKQKRHKEEIDREVQGDSMSPKPSGLLDLNDFLVRSDVKGILFNSGKSKKQKKNVSFSQDDCVFMNSSGDTSRLDPQLEVEAKFLSTSEACSDVNGNSEHFEVFKTGKKRKRSSGYSSADVSFEIDSSSIENSDRSVKRKKKKYKTAHPDI